MNQSPMPSLMQRKRRAILDAALLEFDANGFQATCMDQVAVRADVSKRTVYNHFVSKEELFEAIRRELFNRIADIEYEYDQSTSLQEQLESIATQQVEILSSNAFQTFVRISIPLSLRCRTLAKSTFDAFHESNKTILKFIKCATSDQRLKVDDAKFAAHQFVGLLNANVLWPQLIGGQPALTKAMKKRVVQSTVAMFLGRHTQTDIVPDTA